MILKIVDVSKIDQFLPKVYPKRTSIHTNLEIFQLLSLQINY